MAVARRGFATTRQLRRGPCRLPAGPRECPARPGRVEEALPLLEQVLARESAPARAVSLRGRAALEQRDAAGAERWLSQAVRQAPDDSVALHQLILALRLQGKQAEADRLVPSLEALRKDLARLNELIKIIGRNPKDVRPWHEAGVL